MRRHLGGIGGLLLLGIAQWGCGDGAPAGGDPADTGTALDIGSTGDVPTDIVATDAVADAGAGVFFDAVGAGPDAVVDAGFDVALDLPREAAVADASSDTGPEVSVDAGAEVGVDAGLDAGTDAGLDAGLDAGTDAGTDAGPRCTAPQADCDGNEASGCEVNLDTSEDHCGACGTACSQPGRSCVAGQCVADCRNDGARACAGPTVCDYLTGTCLDPSMACVLTGAAAPCGDGQLPQRCGPGSRCNAASSRCEAISECAGVVCDATNLCHGTGCTLMNGGNVRDLVLAAPTVGPAGMAGGLGVQATVTADGYCGLNVAFEVRGEDGFFVSAGNDRAIWRVTAAGQRTQYLGNIGEPSGVTADRNGDLYYVQTRTGAIRRVVEASGTPRDELFAMLPAPSGNARGLSRLTFGPDGQLYALNANAVVRINAAGQVSTVATIAGVVDNSLTGITFDADGAILAASIRPTVYRIPAGSSTATRLYDVTSIDPGDFFHEAMVLGPDNLVYGSSFPNNPAMGLIYRVNPGLALSRVVTLAEMRRDVPSTSYAGVHGMAFGVDGTLYFVNQNTSGDTRQPLGQLLALRPSGTITLVASGFNLAWPDGYDGDLVAATVALSTGSAPVRAGGVARAQLAVPTQAGNYELRALVIDPRTGSIRAARRAFTVP